MSSVPALAAVALAPQDDAAALLWPLIRRWQAQGHTVAGLVSPLADALPGAPPRSCGALVVQDLGSGRIFDLSQSLGAGAEGCTLDAARLTDAASGVRHALVTPPLPDLIVLNKFGKLEAQGEGLHGEMLAIVEAGVPLLTTVKPECAAAWHAFVGDYGCVLAPQAESVERWMTACGAAAPTIGP